MKDDTISRAAALDALNGCTEIYLNNLPPTIYKGDAVDAIKALPSAQTDTCDGCKWEGAFGYGECQHCKRAFDDMFEEGESV